MVAMRGAAAVAASTGAAGARLSAEHRVVMAVVVRADRPAAEGMLRVAIVGRDRIEALIAPHQSFSLFTASLFIALLFCM